MTQSTQRVGQYNFLKKLGTGRMAEVYLGRIEGAEGFQKPVAIKKILPDLAGDLGFVQSLIAEAKIGGQLHHRNIVEVYDFIRYGNDYCIIMEYVDGVDLGRILRSARRYRVRIPPAAALYIASQVCDGLDYAHSARGFNGEPLNIVHRDLKPSNVLISIKGGVKISDFGIARVMDQVIQRQGAQPKISYQYQSPEQATGSGRLAATSDIFSVGAVLFEMLTLEPLFPGRNVLEALESLRDADLSKRLALAQRQLPGSERVLAGALSPNPADRFRTASMMAEELRRLLVHMKVDDPRERLVTFFQRLVRFVQEQGRRPAEGGAKEGEEWEGGDTRVNDRAVGAVAESPSVGGDEIEYSSPGWNPGPDETVPPMASSQPQAMPPQPPPPAPPPPPEMPSAQPELQAAPAWPPAYGEPTAAQPIQPPSAPPGEATAPLPPGGGGYGWPPGDARTVPTPYAPPPQNPYGAVHEETRVGSYETVGRDYPAMNLAPPPPPAGGGVESTRIIQLPDPTQQAGDMGYGGPAPGAQTDPWGTQAPTDGTQILPNPPLLTPEKPVGRRSRGLLIAIGLLVVLALGGGGVAYRQGLLPIGAATAHGLGCPVCAHSLPADAVYCSSCGASVKEGASAMQPGEKQCPRCKQSNEAEAVYCGNCGNKL